MNRLEAPEDEEEDVPVVPAVPVVPVVPTSDPVVKPKRPRTEKQLASLKKGREDRQLRVQLAKRDKAQSIIEQMPKKADASAAAVPVASTTLSDVRAVPDVPVSAVDPAPPVTAEKGPRSKDKKSHKKKVKETPPPPVQESSSEEEEDEESSEESESSSDESAMEVETKKKKKSSVKVSKHGKKARQEAPVAPARPTYRLLFV